MVDLASISFEKLNGHALFDSLTPHEVKMIKKLGIIKKAPRKHLCAICERCGCFIKDEMGYLTEDIVECKFYKPLIKED